MCDLMQGFAKYQVIDGKTTDIYKNIYIYIYIYIYIWATAKNPAILNMYWTDIGLWKLMEINTVSQINDTPFQGYVIVFL